MKAYMKGLHNLAVVKANIPIFHYNKVLCLDLRPEGSLMM